MITTYLKNKLLNYLFRREAYQIPNTYYVALSAQKPSEDGTGFKEVIGGGYKRLELPTTDYYWKTASNGTIFNIKELEWNEATTDWCTADVPIKYFAIFDAITGGNMLFFDEIKRGKYIVTGNTMVLPIGGITTTILNATEGETYHEKKLP